MTFAQPFKDYEILERVGAGAMGTVFKARHKKLGRIVALKVLRPSLARDERYVDRLRREARIVASLNHPNVVTGYDIGEEGGYHFFVMEFIQGKSLRALLAEWGIFAEEQVLKVGMQVAAALDHAYQKGVIHRDIKPGNILIDDQGLVKLTDLGLAKGPTDMTLTRDGATVGTPQYISPEQARAPQDVDVRSDLYSLGTTLYHMATGQPPFRGDTMAEVITKVLHDKAALPHELNPALSEGLSLVIRKLMAKDMSQRYQTPRELLLDLERVQRAEAPAVDRRALEAAERPPSVSRLLVTAFVLLGALLVAGAVWFGINLQQGETTAVRPDEFFAALDGELAKATDNAGKWRLLEAANAQRPPGTGPRLDDMRGAFIRSVQERLDELVRELQGTDWAEVRSWLSDVDTWPQARDFERQRLSPRLVAATGFTRDQLPRQLKRAGIDDLLAGIDAQRQQRDRELHTAFQQYLAGEPPARTQECLQRDDFAGAARVWEPSLAFGQFFDGRVRPRASRLDDAALEAAQKSFQPAREAAERTISDAEARVLRELRQALAKGLRLLADAAAAKSAEPATLRASLQQLQDQLRAVFPDTGRFRAGSDPWPEVAARCAELALSLAHAASVDAAVVAEQRLDFAYRTLLLAGPDAAVDVLQRPGDDAASETVLAAHRQALTAAKNVAGKLLSALLAEARPVQAFHRSAPLVTTALDVQLENGRPVLRLPRDAGRQVSITELLLLPLLEHVRGFDAHLFDALPAEQLRIGLQVLGVAADDPALFVDQIKKNDDPFVLEQVMPRLQRLRRELGAISVDRTAALARLQSVFDDARSSRRSGDLKAECSAFRSRFGTELRDDERRLVSAAEAFVRRQDEFEALRLELVAGSPPDAEIGVDGDAASTRLHVFAAGKALRPLMPKGWTMTATDAEFRPNAEPLLQRRLEGAFGLPATLTDLTCTWELVLPADRDGERTYVFDLRGVVVVITITADDCVLAAVSTGQEPLRDDALRAAVQRACRDALKGGGKAPRCIPGATHQFSIAIEAPAGLSRCRIKAMFEGKPLLSETRALETRRPPTATLYPLGGLLVRSIDVRGVIR
jgi:tRNA A-37 threonylcarbamoyl transferase component Bud32